MFLASSVWKTRSRFCKSLDMETYDKKLKYIGFGGFGNQVRDVLHIKDLCEIVEIQIKNLI